MIDLYAVLGLKRTASEAEIKSAWRALVKLHHPDLGGDGERLRAITEEAVAAPARMLSMGPTVRDKVWE